MGEEIAIAAIGQICTHCTEPVVTDQKRGKKELGTIRDIVNDTLRVGGYDGLYNLDRGCECGINDLMPGVSNCADCSPGYRQRKDGGWRIGPDKIKEE